MSISLVLLGSVTCAVPCEDRLTLINLLLCNAIPYRDFHWEDDGSITFSLSTPDARRLFRLCRTYGVSYQILRRTGILALFAMLLHRPGLFLGSILAAFLLFFSAQFVWDVDVKGNEALEPSAVKELLAAADLGVGTYIPGIDTRKAENRILMNSPQLSWISLRLDGTCLSVQVIEKTTHEGDGLPPPDAKPANLIAGVDGQIERIELYRGQVMVKCGQAVKAGELLVSGVYDSNAVGYRYTRAAGHIWARTEREFLIQIPLTYQQKIAGEPLPLSRTLHFFNFSLNFFESTGNYEGSCDIIKKETEFHTLAGRLLPVSLSSEDRIPYTEEERRRTPEEALILAYDELDTMLALHLSNAELLQKEITTEVNDTAVVLRVKVTALEDIAQQIPFEVMEE